MCRVHLLGYLTKTTAKRDCNRKSVGMPKICPVMCRARRNWERRENCRRTFQPARSLVHKYIYVCILWICKLFFPSLSIFRILSRFRGDWKCQKKKRKEKIHLSFISIEREQKYPFSFPDDSIWMYRIIKTKKKSQRGERRYLILSRIFPNEIWYFALAKCIDL